MEYTSDPKQGRNDIGRSDNYLVAGDISRDSSPQNNGLLWICFRSSYTKCYSCNGHIRI